MSLLQVFSRKVKQVRAELGLSQFAMAKKLDLGSVVSISNWENEKSFCDLRTLEKLAEFSGHPAYWFLMPDVDTLKKSLRMLPPGGLAAGF